MKVISIIPARMDSSRFPGKPMHPLLGIPMVGHCYFRTTMATCRSETYVATCDQVIADYVESIGGKCVMTTDTHSRATERTAEAMEKIETDTGSAIDIVVMVQGDEPLIPPSAIAETLKHFDDPEIGVVNIMSRFRNQQQFEDKNNVKVVVNSFNDALYFSRESIPSPWKGIKNVPMYNQTGVISFRRDSLLNFNSTPESPLEKIESVDMNRILEHGGKIRMILADASTIGVDTLKEAEDAEELLKIDIANDNYNKTNFENSMQ